MRRLWMKMSVSVDGFVGAPSGENEWVFKSSDEESRAWVLELFKEAGLIIMGRKSFESMSPYWQTADGPFAKPMNELPKAVFTTQKGYKVSPSTSSSTAATSWAQARVFDGNLTEAILQLKQESGKPILAIGGAGFMRSLIETELIDEYYLPIHPAALGAGFTIFPKPLDLKLVDSKAFPGGIVAHTYYPA